MVGSGEGGESSVTLPLLKDAHVVALCIKLFDGVGRGSLHLPCETSRFFVFFGVECRAGGGEGRRKIAGECVSMTTVISFAQRCTLLYRVC